MANEPDDPREDIAKGAGEDASAPLDATHHVVHRGIPPAVWGWIVVILASLFYCYEFALRISPSVMSEALMEDFKISAAAFGTMAASYYYVYTPMQLPVGVLMDMYGPRRLLTLATFACAAGTVFFGMSHWVQWADLSRGLMGFGSAFAFIGAMKLASIWFPPHRFAMFAGVINSLGMVGAMLSDEIMAAMVSHLGWRGTSMVMGGAGVLLGVAIWFVVRDTPPKGYIVHHHHGAKLGRRKLLASLASVAGQRQTWLAGLLGAMMYFPINVFGELWGQSFLNAAYGLNREQPTSVVSTVFLGYAVGSPLAGYLSDHFRNRRGAIFIGAIGAALSFGAAVYIPGLPVWALYALMFSTGFFCGTQAIAFVIGRESNRPEAAGTAIAMVNMIVTAGAALFQPLIGIILDWVTPASDTAQDIGQISFTPEQFRIAFLPLVALMALSLVIIFLTRETHARQMVK